MAAGQPSSMVHPADVNPALAMWVDFAAVQDPRVLVAFENGFGPKACPEEKMGYPRLVIVQRTRVLAFAVNYCRGLSESAVAGVEDRGQAENSHLDAHHSGHSGSCLRQYANVSMYSQQLWRHGWVLAYLLGPGQ